MSNDLKVPFTQFDKLCIIISVLLSIGMIVAVLISWSGLPDIIPTHYDFAGNPNGYGGKESLIFLVCTSIATTDFMIIVGFFPKTWNMSSKLKEENKPQAYAKCRNLLYGLTVLIALIFFYIIICSVTLHPVGSWFMPVTVVVTIGYTVYMLIAMTKFN